MLRYRINKEPKQHHTNLSNPPKFPQQIQPPKDLPTLLSLHLTQAYFIFEKYIISRIPPFIITIKVMNGVVTSINFSIVTES